MITEQDCGWYWHGICSYDTDHFQSTDCKYLDVNECPVHNKQKAGERK